MDQLKIVEEDQADQQVREVFDDIKRTMVTPFVGDVFQAYAAFPPFLGVVWYQIKPLIGTPSFEGLADRIRAHSLACARQHFYVPDHSLALENSGMAASQIDRIRETVEVFHQCGTRFLVISAAVRLGLASGRIGGHGRGLAVPRAGAGAGPVSRQFVPQSNLALAMERIFDEIKASLGIPFVPTELRILARWPEYLTVAWDDLKAQVRAAEFRRRVKEIAEIANAGVQDLPLRRIDGALGASSERNQLNTTADLMVASYAPIVALMSLLRIGMNALLENQLLELEAGA